MPPIPFRLAVVTPAGTLDVTDPLTAASGDPLTVLQAAVGGYVELVDLPAAGLRAWVNEDGHAYGLDINPYGLRMLVAFGAQLAMPLIVGPVVFTGASRSGAAPLTIDQYARIQEAHALAWAMS